MTRLMRKVSRRTALVMRGELVPHDGESWVVTGFDAASRVIWIARDHRMKSVSAQDVDGLCWEDEVTA